MGCTSSREIGDHADASPLQPARSVNVDATGHAGGDPSSSTQAISEGAASLSGSIDHPPRSRSSRNNNDASANARPNQPLRLPLPVANSPASLTLHPWTHRELERQREAFFETRVTGTVETWATLRLVCDMLRAGNVAGAQGILDASGLTCPTGSVVAERQATRNGRTSKKGGVYDDKGVLYGVPGWIVADPEDLVKEIVDEDHDEKAGDIDHLTAGSHVAEKGESPEDYIGELVKVKARLSGKETDVVVTVGREQKIGVVVSKIKDKAKVDKLRLVHMGKMLGENEKLSDTAWAPGHVFNAFVFE
ncbi:hypothetical protein AAFC00_005618 [Neodothiora populina]|uniref:DC-UbP/UBTD2 N-terminal domain-containing protein n=1 Tax=Neodothiora populina TaxID=2781224 RepID=A0ABR3PLH7_9PEZI